MYAKLKINYMIAKNIGVKTYAYVAGQWQHACDKLMEIEVLSPRKPPLFLTKQADSVYNDLSKEYEMNLMNLIR